MKSNLRKFIVICTVFIMCFNIIFPVLSYGANVNLNNDFKDADKTWSDVGGEVLDGIIGILTWIPRAALAAISIAFQTLLTQVCGLSSSGLTLTAEDIIFTGAASRSQQVNILNINFFDFSGNGANESMIKAFRQGVATWYFALRNMAIIISLAVLIYIGIRMAISSVASEKAMYKKMLVDWVVGFLVLFFLHYIIMLIIIINNQLVDLIYSFSNSNSTIMGNYSTELFKNIFSASYVQGWGSLVIYLMLFGTTLSLFIMYMKRLFTTGFLIVISPLITITYSIDKLGDGKSQALSTWLKEFSYNVLIQPFHCIIYMVFVSGAISALDASPSLANMIFAILAILFIFKAEGIVKKIFGFDNASSMAEMATAGALVGNAIGKYNSMKQSKDVKTTNKTTKNVVQRKPIPGDTSSASNQGNGAKTNTRAPSGSAGGNSNVLGSGNKGNVSMPTTNQNAGDTYITENNSNNKSAFARAMSDYMNDKKDNLREFKADPKGSMLNAAKQIPLKQLAATAKFMPKLAAGAIVAGATGNGMTGVITGYSTPGGKFTRKIASYADEDINNLKLENDKKKLAAAFENYKLANKGLSDEQLYNKCADLLEVRDVNKIKDTNERVLAKQLQGMETKLTANGVEDANIKVMDVVEDIQMGNVKNSVTISLDSVSNAANKFKAENPSIGTDKVMETSREFIKDIDDYKKNGEKFLNSDKYKSLGKAEKELAKEIYKSKEVLTAIGDNSIEVINKEIENSIEKGIGG